MTMKNDCYGCWFCDLALMLKIMGKHCKHYRNITNEKHMRIMWVDGEGKYHFESYEIQQENSKQS